MYESALSECEVTLGNSHRLLKGVKIITNDVTRYDEWLEWTHMRRHSIRGRQGAKTGGVLFSDDRFVGHESNPTVTDLRQRHLLPSVPATASDDRRPTAMYVSRFFSLAAMAQKKRSYTAYLNLRFIRFLRFGIQPLPI